MAKRGNVAAKREAERRRKARAAVTAEDQDRAARSGRRPASADLPAAVVMDAHAPEFSEARADLVELGQIAAAREELERRQFAAVLDARLRGATWPEIGGALGVTPQAVHKRYGGSR